MRAAADKESKSSEDVAEDLSEDSPNASRKRCFEELSSGDAGEPKQLFALVHPSRMVVSCV